MLDFLLPQRCVGCRAGGAQLCDDCVERLERLTGPLCGRCGAPTAWPVVRCRECEGRRISFAWARAGVVYRDAAREIVAAWKERGLRRLAAPAAAIVASVVPRPKAEAVTFVPPDGERSAKRGHHPAERLAEELATRWELPAEPLLGRARRAEQRQRGLTLAARRRNVRGAFRPLAAASALRKAGARRVEVVTFARAVRYIG
jgi:competence protein ComFC